MIEQQNKLNLPLGPKCLSSTLAPASSNSLTSLVDSFEFLKFVLSPLFPKQAPCIISKQVYIYIYMSFELLEVPHQNISVLFYIT